MDVCFYVLLSVFFWGIAPIFGKIGLVKANPLLAISIRSITHAQIEKDLQMIGEVKNKYTNSRKSGENVENKSEVT